MTPGAAYADGRLLGLQARLHERPPLVVDGCAEHPVGPSGGALALGATHVRDLALQGQPSQPVVLRDVHRPGQSS